MNGTVSGFCTVVVFGTVSIGTVSIGTVSVGTVSIESLDWL